MVLPKEANFNKVGAIKGAVVSILILSSVVFMLLLSSFSIAAVLTGNVTLSDADYYPSKASFDFITNLTGLRGHITANVTDIDSSHRVRLLNNGSIKFRTLSGGRNYQEFLNINLVNLFNTTAEGGYSTGNADLTSTPPSGDTTQFIIQDGSGGWYHGLLWVQNITWGRNVTFLYKLNNQTGNNTFATIGTCEAYTTPTSCVNDTTNNCEWEGTGALCKARGNYERHGIPPADCGMLPRSACLGINNTVCIWNANAGTFGRCEPSLEFDLSKGLNCTNIINQSICNNQGFTQRNGLCSWNTTGAGTCDRNSSKSFNDIPRPPAFFCEATGYVSNRTNCESLADTYFMPCGWNNQTSKCGPLFFDFDKFEKFDNIGSETSCQTAGGSWKTETTYDPSVNAITSESWCEFGVAVKSFGTIGGGGVSFGGSSGKLNDCSVDCFGCEFQPNGTRWSSSTEAQNACQSSAKGCKFRTDSNAYSGFGWCEPASGYGNFNCHSFCGDCMLLPNASNACQTSPKGCKWDNVTNSCIESGSQGCGQKCQQCNDQASCDKSNAEGGCDWDDLGFYCHPSGNNFEICFDGVDNNNNDKTDCADSKCAFDPFCGGSTAQGASCFQFEPYKYAGIDYARTNCSATSGCSWISETETFGFCAPISERCFDNETLQTDQSLCESFGDGDTCTFKAETRCSENNSMVSICEDLFNQTACMRANNTGCFWRQDLGGGFGECDTKAFFSCEMNSSVQNSESACNAAGCHWLGNQMGSGFEGGFFNKCVSPCFNPSLTNQSACAAANGTTFVAGTCAWQTGFCEPKNFMGGCFESDGDYSDCVANTNCKWFEDRFGPLRNVNGSENFADKVHPGTTWLGIGLQFPNGGTGDNFSIYNLSLNFETAWLWLYSANNESKSTLGRNVTRLYCNSTVLMEYDLDTNTCAAGSCNKYNGTARCGAFTVHYFLMNSTKELEALWEAPIESLRIDATGPDKVVTNTANLGTVVVDGNLSDQVRETATALDGSNATRIRTSSGFCNDALSNNFFAGMDDEPPLIVAVDGPGIDSLTSPSDHGYLDLEGIGVKKTPEAYAYGLRTMDISGSIICNSVSINGGSAGRGSNTSRYYLYLDTDGKSTGGCAADNDASVVGFEYMFKYIAEQDEATRRLSETLLSLKCSSGTWIATNIPFKSDKMKGCDFVNGPIFAIDKDTLTGKSDVNVSKGWRVYATSAHAAGNSSNVSDSVGPGSADFKGIDTDIIDCTSTADKDNSQCTKFKQFGFFPGEFGPACKDNVDNDGDSLTDCNDFDCTYDPFFCGSGTFTGFAVNANDKESPSIVWSKVNDRLPTALGFIYDTNEPSNGSVKFYGNDSRCSTLNTTAYDKALIDGDSLSKFRPHHVSDVTGLTRNTTYFYKFAVCDPSGNCGTSKCSNSTTASTHTNITFKLEIPSTWAVDIPSMNLTNYSLGYALKASTALLDNMNITVHSADNSTAITFVGVDIFEKQTLNVSGFLTGSGYVGIDANQYQSFKQKTGVDETLVKIPTAGTVISHCDEDGANCEEVSDNVDCTTGSSYTLCEVPDAVGLGFSTYKAATASSGGGNNGGGGGGGGGGAAASGGGGAVVLTAGVSKTMFWSQINANEETYFTVNKVDIPVGMIVFLLSAPATNAEMSVNALDAIPPVGSAPNSIYKYVSIEKKNMDNANIINSEIEFSVGKKWLSDQNAKESSVALYRFADNSWQMLPTTQISADAVYSYYRASTPGFSYFAISAQSIPQVPEGLTNVVPIEEVQQPAPAEQISSRVVQTEPSQQEGQNKKALLLIVLAAVIGILLFVVSKTRR